MGQKKGSVRRRDGMGQMKRWDAVESRWDGLEGEEERNRQRIKRRNERENDGKE